MFFEMICQKNIENIIKSYQIARMLAYTVHSETNTYTYNII